ncbi:acid phosphatase [Chitinimonas sp. BJB300]|nr:acid phosphatase [Chitinimonas sp. BJB300]TSJ87383.1 phosphatase PAP2 family protein [Chitinimonas sp. BJB300]
MGAVVSRREWIGMVLVALLLLLVFELTPLDVLLEDPYYQGSRFIGAGNWWLEVFSHHWVKLAVVFIAVGIWGRWALSWLPPRWPIDRHRWLVVGVALLLAPATVSAFKQMSEKPCPWDLARYGGKLPYTSLLEHLPAGTPRGKCFPAGHASTGFALFAIALFWRGNKPRRAWFAWVLALVIGTALGWGQQLRGAHFLSHTLWSAWLCWAVCLVVFAVLQRIKANNPAEGLTSVSV